MFAKLGIIIRMGGKTNEWEDKSGPIHSGKEEKYETDPRGIG